MKILAIPNKGKTIVHAEFQLEVLKQYININSENLKKKNIITSSKKRKSAYSHEHLLSLCFDGEEGGGVVYKFDSLFNKNTVLGDSHEHM